MRIEGNVILRPRARRSSGQGRGEDLNSFRASSAALDSRWAPSAALQREDRWCGDARWTSSRQDDRAALKGGGERLSLLPSPTCAVRPPRVVAEHERAAGAACRHPRALHRRFGLSPTTLSPDRGRRAGRYFEGWWRQACLETPPTGSPERSAGCSTHAAKGSCEGWRCARKAWPSHRRGGGWSGVGHHGQGCACHRVRDGGVTARSDRARRAGPVVDGAPWRRDRPVLAEFASQVEEYRSGKVRSSDSCRQVSSAPVGGPSHVVMMELRAAGRRVP